MDARTGATPNQVASVSVVGRSLTQVSVDATSAFALGSDALAWLSSRGRGHCGVVVWSDGTSELFADTAP